MISLNDEARSVCMKFFVYPDYVEDMSKEFPELDLLARNYDEEEVHSLCERKAKEIKAIRDQLFVRLSPMFLEGSATTETYQLMLLFVYQQWVRLLMGKNEEISEGNGSMVPLDMLEEFVNLSAEKIADHLTANPDAVLRVTTHGMSGIVGFKVLDLGSRNFEQGN